MDYTYILLIIFVKTVFISAIKYNGYETLHACEHGKVILQCNRGEFIKIRNAYYGRLAKSICGNYSEIDITNCFSTKSYEAVYAKCANKNYCEVEAENSIFGDPCPGIIKYLQVEYTCEDFKTEISCESSKLNLACEEGKELEIVNGNYGILSKSICRDSSDISNIPTNCITNHTHYIVKNRCNGLRFCSIEATNNIFGDPCVGLRKYLKVGYTCKASNSLYACENKALHLKCTDGKVIRIDKAIYGKTKNQVCGDGGDTNCRSKSSLTIAKKFCENKFECSLTASNEYFGDPCVGTIKYLEVKYSCIEHPLLKNKPYASICGRTITSNSLIVNGHDTPTGAYPWLVAIFTKSKNENIYICSGSLISKKHVVTAAHCIVKGNNVVNPNSIAVLAGFITIDPIPLDHLIGAESLVRNPHYEYSNADADIGVIQLNREITFTNTIRPICLWYGDNSLSKIAGDKGVVAGWGRDEHGRITTSDAKQIKLPVVTNEECLRSAPQFSYITSNRTFCAGLQNGSGPCNGDSGSGFVMDTHGVWMLRGIVSLSLSDADMKTCDLSYFIVFNDASKFTDWLLSIIS